MAFDEWWRRAILYEIYVRSFADSNGDGVGDLPGITQRLGYVKALGADTVWLSAFYASPLEDGGYDISDHQAVHPDYGTLADFDALVREAHRIGLRVIVDFVPCHTAAEHAWFKEASSSREHPRRNWFVWADPAPGGGPPNNWTGEFGGSAWEWHATTGQYYFHRFMKTQPVLNWRNPAVREALFEVMHFWLARGVDGLRVDAVQLLLQDRLLRDNPPNLDYGITDQPMDRFGRAFTSDQPETLGCVRLIRAALDRHADKLLVGETHLSAERIVKYYVDGHGLHFPLNYRLATVNWNALEVRCAIDEMEGMLAGDMQPCWAVGNHDQPRIAARVGATKARVAILLLLTLRGTPVLYYGDELGLTAGEITPKQVKDAVAFGARQYGRWRDPQRTPMPWNATDRGGFTTGEPWLPVAPNYREINVAAQEADAMSPLSFHRRLIGLRQRSEALVVGDYVPVVTDLQTFGYLRLHGNERWLVLLNFSEWPAEVESGARDWPGRVALSTRLDREDEPIGKKIGLRAQEGLLVRLE